MAIGYGALAQRGPHYFTVVFGLALLNKETALFVPLYLTIDALFGTGTGGRLRLTVRDRRRLVLALAMLVVGVAFVEATREWLLVRQRAEGTTNPYVQELGLVHIRFVDNVRTLVFNVLSPYYSLDFLVNLLVLYLFWLAWQAFLRGAEAEAKLGLLLASVTVTIIVFGALNEARVYSAAVPLALLLELSRRGAFARDGPRRLAVTGRRGRL